MRGPRSYEELHELRLEGGGGCRGEEAGGWIEAGGWLEAGGGACTDETRPDVFEKGCFKRDRRAARVHLPMNWQVWPRVEYTPSHENVLTPPSAVGEVHTYSLHTALVTRAAGCTHTRQAWFRRRVSDRLRSVHFIRTVVAMLQRRNHRSHMCKGSGTEKGRYLVGATAEDNVQVQTRPTTLITPPAYLFWPTLGPSRVRLDSAYGRDRRRRGEIAPREERSTGTALLGRYVSVMFILIG
eukprot:scaffold48381_cov62-Phaeocystis_antarctica.AAC.5